VRKKRVTLRDIAKVAGVSPMTVSRALNRSSKVRAETRKRILSIAGDLDFQPDLRMRELSSGRTKLLGLLVSDIRNPFYAELARGIEDKALESGYNVIYCSTDTNPSRTGDYTNLLLKAGVDGLIFASARLNEPTVKKLIAEKFPLVLVNRKMRGENYNYVVCNNYIGAREITEHLISTGYRKIAIITGSANLSTGTDRLRGYQQALKDSGIPFRKEYVYQGPFIKETGYQGTRQLLSLKNRPEAIFAGNDYIAMGVIRAIGEARLEIPEDIALVGFDDTDFAANFQPKLTTVSQRKYEMGNLGVKTLIDFIEREQTDYIHKIVLEPRLIIRDSCGAGSNRRIKIAVASGKASG